MNPLKVLKIISFLSTLFFSLSCQFCFAENTETEIKFSGVTQKVKGHMFDGEYLYKFQIDEWKYEINETGKGIIKKGETKRTFQLPLSRKFFLDGLNFIKLGKDILFVYGENYGGEGGGFIVLLDGNLHHVIWNIQAPLMNISNGLVKDHYLYQASTGFIFKIDLFLGKYIWKYDNLYDYKFGSFNSFETPKFENGNIIFTEKATGSITKYQNPRFIQVNDKTGKIFISPPPPM